MKIAASRMTPPTELFHACNEGRPPNWSTGQSPLASWVSGRWPAEADRRPRIVDQHQELDGWPVGPLTPARTTVVPGGWPWGAGSRPPPKRVTQRPGGREEPPRQPTLPPALARRRGTVTRRHALVERRVRGPARPRVGRRAVVVGTAAPRKAVRGPFQCLLPGTRPTALLDFSVDGDLEPVTWPLPAARPAGGQGQDKARGDAVKDLHGAPSFPGLRWLAPGPGAGRACIAAAAPGATSHRAARSANRSSQPPPTAR
jgi:hypothetical protein